MIKEKTVADKELVKFLLDLEILICRSNVDNTIEHIAKPRKNSIISNTSDN